MCEADGSTETTCEAGYYEIRIRGHLHDRWAGWFGEMTIERAENGETCLTGPVADQPALHGLLGKVRNTGMPLLSVRRIAPAEGDQSTQQQTQI